VKARHHVSEGDDSHGIDLAPMLDFVLNLLIFFIITTSFVKDTGTKVNQPNADTAEQRESGNILIAVRDDGEIWMDRRSVELREVRGMIERMHVERPQDTVVIVADKASRAGLVAQVMDEVKLGGIRDVALGALAAGGSGG
jgi:biopolymer transport protein ExbD